MAKIRKQSKTGKWLPRIADGGVFSSEQYEEVEHPPGQSHLDRTMPQMMFTVEVGAGQGDAHICYQAQFTEDEMLRITGDWLSKLSSRRAREKMHAKRT